MKRRASRKLGIASTIFPYQEYRGGKAPIVPMKILAGKRWRTVWAYVDSGAAYSILNAAAAKKLGLFKIKARKLAMTTSGGRTVEISLHRLWVKLGKERLSITFGVPRGFDVDFNLLGRRDLFQRYRICFDDAQGFVILSRPV